VSDPGGGSEPECGKVDQDAKNADIYFCAAGANPCPNRIWTEESRNQRCEKARFKNECGGVEERLVTVAIVYTGEQFSASQSGYVCNDEGGLFFSASIPEGYAAGSIANSNRCTYVAAGECVCYSGEASDDEEMRMRIVSCL